MKLGVRALKTQVWEENPIFRQVLGICSALAVTNRMTNTVLMCAGLIWAQTMSSITVSLLRNLIPRRVRMIVQVLIIAAYVICVGLIVTNCIIMGRLEGYASKNPVLPSFFDGLGAGLGYSAVLVAVASVRELLGFGSLFGQPLLGGAASWRNWTIMVTPPGAFFVLAIWVWAARAYAMRRQAAQAGEQGKNK